MIKSRSEIKFGSVLTDVFIDNSTSVFYVPDFEDIDLGYPMEEQYIYFRIRTGSGDLYAYKPRIKMRANIRGCFKEYMSEPVITSFLNTDYILRVKLDYAGLYDASISIFNKDEWYLAFENILVVGQYRDALKQVVAEGWPYTRSGLDNQRVLFNVYNYKKHIAKATLRRSGYLLKEFGWTGMTRYRLYAIIDVDSTAETGFVDIEFESIDGEKYNVRFFNKQWD